MRFVQVFFFYPAYLASFYQRNPTLADESYEVQRAALLNDGFYATHFFAEQLRRVGCDAHSLIGNCEPLQRAWAREHGTPFEPESWHHTVLAAQVDALQPDILYLSDPINYDSRFVRSLKTRPSFVAGWRAAIIPPWSDFTEIDLILSSDPITPALALKHGARATEHFLPGFPSWIAEAVRAEPTMHDVVLCGQLTADHIKRIELVEQLSFYSKNTSDFIPAFFVHIAGNWNLQAAQSFIHPALWGMDLYRGLRRGKIGLNNVIDFARGEGGNMRQFEVTGCGSLLLTEEHPTLSSHFEPGREVETYGSFEELVEKIAYYSSHDSEREEIARRGQERCLRDHSLERRAEWLVEILRSHAGNIGPTRIPERQPESVPRPDELMRRAIDLIQQNEVAESYQTSLQALKWYPHARYVHYMQGLALLKMQRIAEACEALRSEVSLFPDSHYAIDLIQQVERALSAVSVQEP